MTTHELKPYLGKHQSQIVETILQREYVPGPILGVEIPRSNGKTRLLGVPTVVERWLQQAVSQQLAAKFGLNFEEESYGFRPKKNLHQAAGQSLKFINDGYQDIVDIDLKCFFDEVAHYKLLQLIFNKVKCPATLWLIRKWLRAPIRINGRMYKRRKGVPQGSPLSLLLSNILLDELDKELKRKLKQITKKTKPYSFDERIEKLKEVWRGWVNNYRLASIHSKLKTLAQSPILGTTITLSRLRKRGYESMLDYYLKMQPQIR